VYSEKIPVDGQRNCTKHVEFYSKNKFEKLVRSVGFIIRMEGYSRPLAQVLRSVSGTDLEEFRRLGQRDRQLTLKDGAHWSGCGEQSKSVSS